MKKIILFLMTALMVFSITPVELKAAGHTAEIAAEKSGSADLTGEDTKTVSSNDAKHHRAERRAERKKNRAEKRDHGHGGLYISAGAIIVIVLVLIILL